MSKSKSVFEYVRIISCCNLLGGVHPADELGLHLELFMSWK